MKSMNTHKVLVLSLVSLISFSSAVHAVRFVPSLPSMEQTKKAVITPLAFSWNVVRHPVENARRAASFSAGLLPSMKTVKNAAVAPVYYPWCALKASYRGGKRAKNNIASLISCYFAPTKEDRLLNQAHRLLPWGSYNPKSTEVRESAKRAAEKVSQAFDLISDRFEDKNESCDETRLAIDAYTSLVSPIISANRELEDANSLSGVMWTQECLQATRDALAKSRRMPYAQSFFKRAMSKASGLVPSWPFSRKVVEEQSAETE